MWVTCTNLRIIEISRVVWSVLYSDSSKLKRALQKASKMTKYANNISQRGSGNCKGN